MAKGAAMMASTKGSSNIVQSKEHDWRLCRGLGRAMAVGTLCALCYDSARVTVVIIHTACHNKAGVASGLRVE